MREIKFKAWDKKNKEWVAGGDAMNLNHCVKYNILMFDNDHIANLRDLDLELVQFTGLLDKNGKEIYEGDIAKLLEFYSRCDGYYDDAIAEICWDEKYCCFYAKVGNSNESIADNEVEIIGNKFEHPHLLD